MDLSNLNSIVKQQTSSYSLVPVEQLSVIQQMKEAHQSVTTKWTSSNLSASYSVDPCGMAPPATIICQPDISLAQLLSTNTLHQSSILPRPTPIHPNEYLNFPKSSILMANNKLEQAMPSANVDSSSEINNDTPLDLSLPPMTIRQHTVIQSSSKSSPSESQTLLPMCNNPSLNVHWIAEKLGVNRMSYPREFKLLVINYYHNNGQNKYRTCKEFQITKSMLNGWLQKLDKIKQSRPGSLKSGRSGRKPQFPKIESQLFHLYSSHLCSGQKVGNRWIRETARQLAQQQCSPKELAGMCQFSERWLSNFKKRYRINLNRDWSSSGASSRDSAESLSSLNSSCATTITSSSNSTTGSKPNCHITLALSNENTDDDEVDDIQNDIIKNCDHLAAQVNPSVNLEPFTLNQAIISSDCEQIKQILHTPGRLPIHVFYERFPWLWRKNQTGAEPGRRGRKVQFPGVEKVLFERLKKHQSSGERISNRWLQQQARELAAQLCPEILHQATRSARCLFSEHWLHNFKKRYGIILKHSNLGTSSTGSSHYYQQDHQSDNIQKQQAIEPIEISDVQSNKQILSTDCWYQSQQIASSSDGCSSLPLQPAIR